MNFAKIFGWALLLAGIIIISWTLYASYNIFTAKELAPEFFTAEQEKETSLLGQGGVQDIQAQLEKMIGEQLKGLLPADSITKLLNLVIWSILAFVLIFGGTQISGLGIRLLKS